MIENETEMRSDQRCTCGHPRHWHHRMTGNHDVCAGDFMFCRCRSFQEATRESAEPA